MQIFGAKLSLSSQYILQQRLMDQGKVFHVFKRLETFQKHVYLFRSSSE